jgi:hypothetical protein
MTDSGGANSSAPLCSACPSSLQFWLHQPRHTRRLAARSPPTQCSHSSSCSVSYFPSREPQCNQSIQQKSYRIRCGPDAWLSSASTPDWQASSTQSQVKSRLTVFLIQFLHPLCCTGLPAIPSNLFLFVETKKRTMEELKGIFAAKTPRRASRNLVVHHGSQWKSLVEKTQYWKRNPGLRAML